MTHKDYKTVLYRQDHGSGLPRFSPCRMLCADDVVRKSFSRIGKGIGFDRGGVPPGGAALARGYHRKDQWLARMRAIFNLWPDSLDLVSTVQQEVTSVGFIWTAGYNDPGSRRKGNRAALVFQNSPAGRSGGIREVVLGTPWRFNGNNWKRMY
jgi:hypothetical protein